jgi:flavin-dependent dehydrogenase
MYDAIVIGARCAGAPTAMLLARRGHRVLLVDRATFPSDTMSTHLIHAHGLAALRRWGLLDELIATGVPACPTLRFDFGPVVLEGTPPAVDGISEHYAPRRRVLDKLLVDAAVAAGVEVREQTSVKDLLWDDGRVTGVRLNRGTSRDAEQRARIVIGADGVRSTVAEQVGARTYHDKGNLTCAYYSYWSGVESPRLTLYPRPGGAVAEIPTHDGLTCIYAAWPVGEFHAVRSDTAGSAASAIERHAPDLAARMRNAAREERFLGSGRIPNFFRQSHGPGWALVGDAAYHKDPIGARGITDSFRDAERVARAVHAGLTGRENIDTALARCQQDREESSLGRYELNSQFAALQPPTPELQALVAALASNQPDTDRFIGADSGTVPVSEFFSPENLARIAGAAPAAHAVESEAGVL